LSEDETVRILLGYDTKENIFSARYQRGSVIPVELAVSIYLKVEAAQDCI
jgi:hypothetical protein